MWLHTFKFAFVFCTCCALTWNNSFVIEQSVTDVSVVLGTILKNYLVKYFSDIKIFVSIVLAPSKYDRSDFQEDFFDNLFDEPALTKFAYNVLCELDNEIRDNRNAFNVVLLEDCTLFSNVINETIVQEFHLSQRFLIMVIGTEQNVTKALKQIFDLLWLTNLMDSHVLIQEQADWQLYTFFPYKKDCLGVDHIKIETFTSHNYTNNMTMSLEQLYPRKLNNFNNCSLYIAATSLEPLVIADKTNGSDLYTGIDICIIDQIAKTLKFNIEFKHAIDGFGHGVMFSNHTLTGNIALLCHGVVNLTVGGYALTSERSTLFAYSHPYLQASVGFSFKERDANIPFFRLTAPFTKSVWLTIVAVLVLSIAMLLLSKNLTSKWRHFIIGGRLNRTPILYMWTYVLGNPISNPRFSIRRNFSTFARTLTLLWILLWIVIRNSYQGALYTYLQGRQMTSPYDTVEKIQASECKISTLPSAFHFLKTGFKRDRFVFKKGLETAFREMYDKDLNAVTLTNDLTYKAFNLKNSQRRLAFTKDRVFMYSPVILFRKKSVLTSVFNEQIQAIGITDVLYS